jgi:hypothetical protein
VALRRRLLTLPSLTHCRKKFIEIAMEAGVVAQEAHDRKLQKSLAVCEKEGIHFVALAWEQLYMRLFASGLNSKVLVDVSPRT